MSHETITTPPVLPPPPAPPYPPAPQYSPRPRPPADERRRRWPALAAAVGISAVLASIAAAAITTSARDATPTAEQPAPVTITVPAPTPKAPTPLPTAQADRQICQKGWLATQEPTRAANSALDVLPGGMKVLDPAVRSNADWASAVRRAGELYRQAGGALEAQIVPGATPILTEAAKTAVNALRGLGDSYVNFEPVSGNTQAIAVEAADQMAVLCTRLAP